jgi:hypothetical protein
MGEIADVSPDFKSLPPGQQDIIKSFRKHGADSVYAPSDIMDLRVCSAMTASAILIPYRENGELIGYELTTRGCTLDTRSASRLATEGEVG